MQSKSVELLNSLFAHYKVKATVANVIVGNAVTRYEIEIDPFATKIADIEALSEGIAFALRVKEKPIILPLYEKGVVALDIVNATNTTLPLTDLIIDADTQMKQMNLPLLLGRDLQGNPYVTDLTDMPHVLIGGTTGSGKSVGLRSMIAAMLCSGANVQFVLIDPKQVDLGIFSGLNEKHLYVDHVISDCNEAESILEYMVKYIDDCYTYLAANKVSNVSQLKGDKKIPYTVIVIDELADLLLSNKNIESILLRITQKARAAGVHIIAATQRPSADIISGAIKANLPGRIAYKVSTATDSRVILERAGAERLLGRGDMLFKKTTDDVDRIQGAYADNESLNNVLSYCDLITISKSDSISQN